MKIACVQLNTVAGQPSLNVQNMKNMIDDVRGKADIIVFNEMCISGYFLADRYNDLEWLKTCASYNQDILDYSQDIGVIWGNIYLDQKTGHDGRLMRYNCAFFAYNGEWVKRENQRFDGMYVKTLLPNYRVFDDERYFSNGEEFCLTHNIDLKEMNAPFIFGKSNTRISLQVCEDLWSSDYRIDPTKIAIEEGAELIVNISSSPWTHHKEQSRVKQIKKHAKTHQEKMVPFVYANIVGMQNTGKNVLVFDGGSGVYDNKGDWIGGCFDDFTQGYQIVEVSKEASQKQPQSKSKLMNALVCGLREFDRQLFPYMPKWIVGVSGGLDSSVNVALLTMAIGKERVIGVNMASKYNQLKTINNARSLCENLGIEYRECSIESLVEASDSTLKSLGYQDYPVLVSENVQARIRGHILSSIASVENGVILNNGNKVEHALGYATLYGDTIGALSVLGDCTKLQVVELGQWINEYFEKEIVPVSLLATITDEGISWDLAPSAELKDKQIDPMKWGYHDQLVQWLTEYPSYAVEDIMEMYLDGSIADTSFGKWVQFYQLDGKAFIEDLEWVLRQMRIAVFKRIQTPPIIMVSRGAFGSDFRENQLIYQASNRYNELKRKILEKE